MIIHMWLLCNVLIRNGKLHISEIIHTKIAIHGNPVMVLVTLSIIKYNSILYICKTYLFAKYDAINY